MESLRKFSKKIIRRNKCLELQVIDWYASNIEIVDDDAEEVDEDEEKNKYSKELEYNIKAFCNTKKGTSVLLNINGFPPHLYVNVPDDFTNADCSTLIDSIKAKLPSLQRKNIISFDKVKRKKFWGFTNNKQYVFLRILFKNTYAMRSTEKVLNGKLSFPGRKSQVYEVYESNIPPLLRFFHINNIEPSGWIRLEKNTYTVSDKHEFTTQLCFNVHWKDVKIPKTPKLEMAPFLISSYDIECDSSHGDFPLPKKDYLKLSQEISERYYSKQLTTYSSSKLTEELNTMIYDGFFQNTKDISKLYTKSNITPKKETIKLCASKATRLFKITENYKILASDIISNYLFKIDDGPLGLVGLIDDAFCDNMDTKETYSMNKIYTKSNEKPTKKGIDNNVRIIINILEKFYNNNNESQEHLKKHMIQFSDYYYLNKEESTIFFEEVKYHNEVLTNKLNMLCNQITSVFNESFPEISTTKDVKIKRINTLFSNTFPELEGDKVIQIGTAVQKFGDHEPYLKHIVTLGTCDPIENTTVISCETEEEVLMTWANFIVDLDPDIITGYNIFGFDYSYMYERARELDIEDEFSMISRIKMRKCDLFEKQLSSSALGDNTLKYIDTIGRINMDLLKIVQRDHNLESYKLDFVAETFMNDSILEINTNELKIKNAKVLTKGNYITLLDKHNEKYKNGHKFKIVNIDYKEEIITLEEDLDNCDTIVKWCLAKDDVSPNDIFRLQKENSAGRCIIATYCIQDCVLVLHIINKLQIITNNIAMANTCSVPLSFIFLRGQGIKVFSLVSKECRKEKILIPVIQIEQDVKTIKNPKFEYSLDYDEKPNLLDSYEGAIVLKPNPGIYLDKYVTVLDYSSLYPSSMISENLSHDSICLDEKYLGEKGAELLKELGYDYVDITHDVYKWKDPKIRTKGKYKAGVKTCRFAQPPDGGKSIIPSILRQLLKARKDTRKKQKNETDEFKWGVLEGQQLSYKITANSVYGSIGASTSSICMKNVAASTTAIGRSLLELAQEKTLEKFAGAEIVYGDTDSIFINFNPCDNNGMPLKDKDGLQKAIDMGVQAEEYIQQFLKAPHRLEYEKTFYPFILFSKKRYIGYKFEHDVNKYTETSMGIVTKRRDNAKIVKYVYKRVMDCLLKEKNLEKSIKTLQEDLRELLDGKFELNMLTITKSLRGFYANPEQIAHKVLADRMGERDPGNKPQSNDRIPYVYVETKIPKDGKILQGNRIEHPQYIIENSLKPDYSFYITNQIMKPVGQIFSLIVETLPGFSKSNEYFKTRHKYYYNKYDQDEKKTINKVTDEKMIEVSKLVFGEILRKANNARTKSREITDFFKIKN